MSVKAKRIALVLSNPSYNPLTKSNVGFWWSEITHPYLEFVESGYEVHFFSPAGGKCEADAMSDPRDPASYPPNDIVSLGFLNHPKLAPLIENTKKISECSVADYDAILVGGGLSPQFSFESADGAALIKKFAEFYEHGKIVAALCHGVLVLRDAKLSNGSNLVSGKTVTGWCNAEDVSFSEALWQKGVAPKGSPVNKAKPEDELKKAGANFVHGPIWKAFAVRDGNLITGQQNWSGRATAQLIITALGQ